MKVGNYHKEPDNRGEGEERKGRKEKRQDENPRTRRVEKFKLRPNFLQ